MKDKLPSILYFPTFAFEIPEQIFLQTDNNGLDDSTQLKNKYYLAILQDILDSIGNNLTIKQHILDRMISNNQNEIESMRQTLLQVSRKVDTVIMEEWERIFGRKMNDKIRVEYDISKRSVYFRLEGETESKIYHKSLGFKWFFCFLLFTQFRGKRKDNSKVLFLFDEPASNLHSTAQKRLLESFNRIASDNCSIIYTTHSHYMINPKWLEHTYISENEALNIGDEKSDSEYTFDASKDISIRAWKHKQFVSENPSKTTYYQPILDVLDYKPTELELYPLNNPT